MIITYGSIKVIPVGESISLSFDGWEAENMDDLREVVRKCVKEMALYTGQKVVEPRYINKENNVNGSESNQGVSKLSDMGNLQQQSFF